MRARWLVCLMAVGLVLAACGSRSKDKSSGTTTTTTTKGSTASTAKPADAGPTPDPDAPCGPGNAKGATDQGVTDDTIEIATIETLTGPRPGLFQGNRDAMDAFVAYCNSLGGINGRTLELNGLDDGLFNYKQAIDEACGNAFALVGTGAVFDGAGSQAAVDCDIPDVPAFTVEAGHADATNMVQPLPNPPGQWAVGDSRYLMKKFPGIQKKAAILYVNAGTTEQTAKRQVEGDEQVGWHYIIQSPIDISVANWGPFVEQVRSQDAQYYFVQSDLGNLIGFQQELQAQGVKPEVAEAGQQAYDPTYLEQGGDAVEGTHIEATTVPFEEKSTSPELQRYLHWLEQAHPGATPTALGVQGWSAGLLFATRVKELGSQVTRKALLDKLRGVHTWDGHGIHVLTDPGANDISECFMLLQVKDGKFVREFPSKAGTFSCSPKNRAIMKGDYGKGAGR